MTGTLYGLGLGPGDPELVTLKAARLLAGVPVIAYPAPLEGDSLARAIAAPHLAGGQIEIPVRLSFTTARTGAEAAYDRAAEDLAGHLTAGRDVAMLCLGDPFLYGSFMHLFARLGARFPVEIVPGVTAVTAAAAAAAQPLAGGEETLVVVPATLPEARLRERLRGADAAAILKIGRHLGKVRRVLAELGLAGEARYVENATTETQRVRPLAEVDGETPYFSMILAWRTAGSLPVTSAAASSQAPAPVPPADVAPAPVPAGVAPTGVALVALTPGGLALAQRLRAALPQARVHAAAGLYPIGVDPAGLDPAGLDPIGAADEVFTEITGHLRALFAAGTPILALTAAGIVVRALAPLLADKRAEPPVVAMAEDGSVAVPLLGGHHGANALARAVAAITGASAAITTGGEVRLGLALDAPPPGWRVANPAAAKAITMALLRGAPVRLIREAGDGGWLSRSGLAFQETARAIIRVTDRVPGDGIEGGTEELVLHPPVLSLGVGCARGTAPEELLHLARETLAEAGLAEAAVACVCSLDLKEDEPAVHALAAALGVPARFFTAAALEAERPRLHTPSEVVFRETGCHGVAEGAALAVAGPDGALIKAKVKSPHATVAVGRAPAPINAAAIGHARGVLRVVGLGPGAAEWLTPEARTALARAEDLVGYTGYLDLVAGLGGGLIAGKRRHDSDLGEETARVRHALDLAAQGREVALVSSGDAGIYAMAALVFELIDREARPAWARLKVEVVPGVSAMQAAAARIGAPLGHDFCAISLSDLLTPWDEIARRLRAAAQGDFVVALYNPVSRRRRHHLETARDILLGARPPSTPVILARQLGREGERVEVIPLAELRADKADMLTLVLVGSSRSRIITRGGRPWVYTPRGYGGYEEEGKDLGFGPGQAAAPAGKAP